MAQLPEVIYDMGATRWVADAIVAKAKKEKVNEGLVYIASIYNANAALAMRTFENSGWGLNTDQFALDQQDRIKFAQESTRYAIAARRSASKQREYEKQTGRTPDSYGQFPYGFRGKSVFLEDLGIVATFQSKLVEATEAESLVWSALYTRENIVRPENFLDVLVDELKNRIDVSEQSGIVMTSLKNQYSLGCKH